MNRFYILLYESREGKPDFDEVAIRLTKLSASRLKHSVLHTSWSVRYTRFRDLHEGVYDNPTQFVASLIGKEGRTEISHLFLLSLQVCVLGKRGALTTNVVHVFKLRARCQAKHPVGPEGAKDGRITRSKAFVHLQ